MLSEAMTMVSTNAAASEPRVTTSWTGRRSGRGVKASTRTPTTAAPKTTSIGASWPYSMLGGLIAPGVRADKSCDAGHGAVPFCPAPVNSEAVEYPGAGCAGTGSVWCTCAIVTRTAGLMMSSTGLG